MSIAERFHDLFLGLSRAHGQYKITGKSTGRGKKDGYGTTIHKGASTELWKKHLKGAYGLGIVPIQENNTCRFGAIDIDKYDKDLKRLAEQLERLELPLIVCRSKSGGAHLYLFCREDVPASLVRDRLMEWSVVLGYSGVEVFPKQVSLAGPEDVGNWINMPYYNAEETDRFGVFGGRILDAEGFLDIAEMMAVTQESLSTFQIPEGEGDLGGLLHEGPPCLQTLASRGGFGEGGRNNGLFAIAIYLRKRYGDDDWKDKLDDYNQKFFNPPLDRREVNQVARNNSKKEYQYKCNEPPINSVCNRQLCLTRQFGIGGGKGDPGVVFGTLVKINTNPPIWIWDVNGQRISLSTNELMDQGRFNAKVMENLNTWPNPVKKKDWQELVQSKLQSVEIIEAPLETSTEGTLWIHLQNYLENQPGARHREEMLQGKPWIDNGVTYFSAVEFRKYLNRQHLNVTEKEIWAWLREKNAGHGFWNLKNRGLNWWSIPSFKQQTEEFDVPSILDQDEPM